jgi:hypothetical protein
MTEQNDYEEKIEDKRTRLLDRADELEREADRMQQASRASVEHIPLGQPILVGHHSEGRHRRALEQSNNRMRSAVALREKAASLRQKAESVGTGGISSDDPDAVTKLRRKLETLQEAQNEMKRFNKAFRTHGKPKPDDDAGWAAFLEDTGFSADMVKTVRSYMAQFTYHKQPFPGYQLTNNNAKIKNTEKRIADLLRERERQAEEVKEVREGYTYKEDDNRAQFIFEGKPSKEARDILKANSFKWTPSRGSWGRLLTNNARYDANLVKKKLEGVKLYD